MQKYIDEHLISEKSHPKNSDIKIYNYTAKCQFDKKWDEITMKCRGLIINTKTNKLLSNPFSKFFNYGEYEDELPKEIPVISEKYDGSLGILYWIENKPYITTRGSFESEQSIWATKWLNENIDIKYLNKNKTYLFEIIYPENRIVVNYDFSGLVLLAIRDIKTGKEEELQNIVLLNGDFLRSIELKKYTNKLEELQSIQENNKEGFVIFYKKANLRLKIKFNEYVRLHRILTGISNIAVWEYLKDGRSFEELLEKVPDEFYKWLTETIENLRKQYNEIELICKNDLEKIPKGDRKKKANFILKKEFPHVLFKMMDDKNYSELIWKKIRPTFSKAFKIEQ